MSYKKLEKEIKGNLKELDNKERKEFKYVILKIRYSTIMEKDKCEFLQQLLDSVLIAQKEGKTIADVIGTKDIQTYCNMILKEYRDAMPKKLLLVKRIARVLSILLPLMILSALLSLGKLNTELNYEFTSTSYFTLEALIIDTFFVVWSLLETYNFYAVYKSKLLEFTSNLIAIIALLIISTFSQIFRSIVLFSGNIFVFIIIDLILFFISTRILKK